MIVKILSKAGGGAFPGAAYNENKVAAGVAELIMMKNVDEAMQKVVSMLHQWNQDASKEVEAYLKEHSETYGNTRTEHFQFHVSASVQGRSMSADELAGFAKELMEKIGYGMQPYFVYFHHDTDNNHVHILSTRIRPNGFPISEHQDYRRINEAANQIMQSSLDNELDLLRKRYCYTSLGQFRNILASAGYSIREAEDSLIIYKNGAHSGTIPKQWLLSRTALNGTVRKEDRKKRASQLKEIIQKYQKQIADGKVEAAEQTKTLKGRGKTKEKSVIKTELRKIVMPDGWKISEKEAARASQLLDTLKQKFGIDVYFQKDRNGNVRGYGIVDHGSHMAFDGSEVLKLKELISPVREQKKATATDVYRDLFRVKVEPNGNRGMMTITMCHSGMSCEAELTSGQMHWYANSEMNKREDLAYQLAAVMFTPEIIAEAMRKDLPNGYCDPRISRSSVIKLKSGEWAIRIQRHGDNPLTAELTSSERKEYMAVRNTDGERPFLDSLATLKMIENDAHTIYDRFRTAETQRLKLPRYRKDYNQTHTTALSAALAQLIQSRKIPSPSTSHGENREWEVGRKGYDDPDAMLSGLKT